MLAYTYVKKGDFRLLDKPRPTLLHPEDAVVRVTLSSICTSDLHIKHGAVPRAVPGITVGHEMVGVVEEVGSAVRKVRPGDRVSVNVRPSAGHAFSAVMAGSTTVRTPTAAGRWAAASTAGRQNMFVSLTPTRASRPSRTTSATAKPCSWETSSPPAIGQRTSPTSPLRRQF